MELRWLEGLAAVEAAGTVCRRRRALHPTAGLWEAADFQWWWRTPRPTDAMAKPFWFVDGDPVAAVMFTQWGDRVGVDPVTVPTLPRADVDEVVRRGVAAAEEQGVEAMEVRVAVGDQRTLQVLGDLGFEQEPGDEDMEGWLDVAARPAVSPPPPGYQLRTRADVGDVRPHHMTGRGGPGIEARLRQTPLYRDDLDLLVETDDNDVAAYALCWFDPGSATGLVEPMRTEEGHEGRGLARHLLTAGVERLAAAGATRVKIAWMVANPATSHLYPDVGFVPTTGTVVLCR